MEKFSEWFWTDSFWLPPNITWKDFEQHKDTRLPNAWETLLSIPLAFLLLFLRLCFERFFAAPIGRYYKLKEKPAKPPKPIEALEKAFKMNKAIPQGSAIEVLAKKTDMSTRQVERWFRRKRVSCNPSVMQKFKETSWRFTFYKSIFWYAIWALWDKPYFTDTTHCWIGFPYQPIDQSIWWYYQIEIAFYWSLIMSSFMDVKRKDFYEMFSHHISTIILTVFTFMTNFIRFGALVMVIHDAVDWWLEGAKLAKYLRYSKLTDFLFVCFTIVWAITRLYIYPYYLLYAAYFEIISYIGYFPMHTIYCSLLTLLQILHIYWFVLICKMVYKYVITGTVEKDERSESEVESSDAEGKNNNKNGKVAN